MTHDWRLMTHDAFRRSTKIDSIRKGAIHSFCLSALIIYKSILNRPESRMKSKFLLRPVYLRGATARRSTRAFFTVSCIPHSALIRPSHARRLFSVSSTEIDKFSAMDQDWWDPKKNVLIPMNTIRMKYIREMVRQSLVMKEDTNWSSALPLEGYSALDIGCGGGLLSESLARLGATVTGLDPSARLVEAAKQHAALHPRTRTIDYQGGKTVEEFAQEHLNKKYDIICLLEVLEHSTDAASLLRAASALLKDDGLLFLSTINRTLKSHLATIVGAEYIMRYIPIGTHNWYEYRSPEEVARLMDHVGVEEVHVSGMVLTKPPFFGNWSWKLDPTDTDINWIGAYRKRSDFR
jgi:ubiquinone biosynthesis O-methyltransferase